MGLWVWPRNKGSIITVEESRFTVTEINMTMSVECEDNFGGLFRFYGYHASWICQIVNQEYYKSVLERLHENLRKKRPTLLRDKNWILHHDNASAHRASSIIEFLAIFQIAVLPQPPHSSDVAPADFYLFPKLKFSLKGYRYDSIEDIQANMERVLNTLRKENFQECFQKWKHRWSRCVQTQGDYFEEDPSQ